MSRSSPRRPAQYARTAAAIILALAAGSLTARPALAGITSCRSDPVVTLSNGTQIDLQAGINDSAADVQSIVYTVHAPAGTSLVSVVNTGSVLGLVERVTFYADAPARTYDTYTTVTTGASNVAVTATTTIAAATVVQTLGVTLASQSVSGWNGQALHTQTIAAV